MSLEIQSRTLAALIMLGENPSNIKLQESMLSLTPDLFSDSHCRELFDLIADHFVLSAPFDLTRMMQVVPKSLFDHLMHIAPMAWSYHTLTEDIKYLIDSRRLSIMKDKFNQVAREAKGEPIPELACSILTDGCIEIGKLGALSENHVFTAEMNAHNYLTNQNVTNKLIPSGIQTLDKLNGGGFKENCLITIAGRSGMGKTCFGVHLAHHLAVNAKHPHVLFYSLEMSAADIYEKQLVAILGHQLDELPMDEREYGVNASRMVPFTIITKPLASISYIETTSRIMAIKQPMSVIVVDYLGIVQNTSKLESHTLKQADIALRLSALAAELNCIVIALTQVNRDHAGRQDKTPITADAADSSGSERSSTYWLGIYRPIVDDMFADPQDFIVKCRKNRFGPTWTALFAFNQATFAEMNQERAYEQPKQAKGIDAYKNKIMAYPVK